MQFIAARPRGHVDGRTAGETRSQVEVDSRDLEFLDYFL